LGKKKRYDSGLARRRYIKQNNINEKKWVCGNPDCQRIFPVDELEIHHLLPRRTSPSLMYNVSNMILICSDCHKEIEKIVLKNKLQYQERKLIFCDICGFMLFGRRDRFGKKIFHHRCFLSKIYDKEFIFNLIQDELVNEDICFHKWRDMETFKICLICGKVEKL